MEKLPTRIQCGISIIGEIIMVTKRNKAENHAEWVDTLRKRTEVLVGDWTPFIKNVDDICTMIKELHEHIEDFENELGETKGMIKNLRKILIKLEVIDDRFIF
jgi:archaellum component FlaC